LLAREIPKPGDRMRRAISFGEIFIAFRDRRRPRVGIAVAARARIAAPTSSFGL
jgi:hypothetical protein